ncbi:MAG: hypothetical protein ACOC2E_02270 [Bacteroidota bacterium]
MIKKKLAGHFNKNELVKLIKDDEKLFDETLKLAINQQKDNIGWRAAWILNQVIIKNDDRIVSYASQIIEIIEEKEDGHQRELLKIIEKISLDEKWESKLLQLSIGIWKQVGKSPSVRIVAWRIILKIVEKYPELQTEIAVLSDDCYAESLSPGIRSSFFKLRKKLKIPENQNR